jgi:hypothetical protein
MWPGCLASPDVWLTIAEGLGPAAGPLVGVLTHDMEWVYWLAAGAAGSLPLVGLGRGVGAGASWRLRFGGGVPDEEEPEEEEDSSDDGL